MSYHYNTSKRLFNESSDADTSDNETKPCETNFIIIHFVRKENVQFSDEEIL